MGPATLLPCQVLAENRKHVSGQDSCGARSNPAVQALRHLRPDPFHPKPPSKKPPLTKQSFWDLRGPEPNFPIALRHHQLQGRYYLLSGATPSMPAFYLKPPDEALLNAVKSGREVAEPLSTRS